MVRRTFALLIAVGTPLACDALAQTSVQERTEAGQLPSDSASALAAELSADDAIRAARELLDRLDAGAAVATEDSESLGRYLEAIRMQAPSSPWLAYLQGRTLVLTGQRFDAISHLRAFLETREGRNDWKTRWVLGDLFLAEYPQLAKTEYEAADRLKPDEPAVLYGLSAAAAKLGRTNESLELARRVVEADGRRTVRYLRHLARLLASERQWPEASREAVNALRAAQEQATSRPGERAPLQLVDAQYQLIIEVLQERLSSLPGSDENYLELVRLLGERAANIDKLVAHDVLAVLKKGVEDTAPDTSPGLRERYAVALAEVGRREEAITEFEKVLAADPASVTATDWLARLRSEAAEPQSDRAP